MCLSGATCLSADCCFSELMRLLLIGPERGLNSFPLLSIIKTKNSIILIFYITICLIFNDTIPQNNVNSLGNKEFVFSDRGDNLF
jgi:hypothetical protein